MASAYYKIGLQKIIDVDGAGDSARIDMSADTIKVRTIRTGVYVFSANDASMTPITAAVGQPADPTLGTKSLKTTTDGGCFGAANTVFSAYNLNATAVTACIIYRFTTSDAGSIPIVYLDGFTFTPNGGDITLQWAASTPFIFKI